MILSDRVFVVTGGGKDAKGNPLPDVDNGPYPAQVKPIRSDEPVAYGQPPLVAYYRLFIGRSGGHLLTPTGKVKWRGQLFTVQGDVEPWTIKGRLSHYEATLKRAS